MYKIFSLFVFSKLFLFFLALTALSDQNI